MALICSVNWKLLVSPWCIKTMAIPRDPFFVKKLKETTLALQTTLIPSDVLRKKIISGGLKLGGISSLQYINMILQLNCQFFITIS